MAKKRKIKKKVKILFILILLIAIGLIVFWKKDGFMKKVSNETNKIKEVITKEKFPKKQTISLVATGDGLLHNSVYYDAYDPSKGTFDFSSQLSEVKDIVGSYDIAYYNQETLFGGKQTDLFSTTTGSNVAGYSSYPYFNSPSEFGDAMVDIGFNMVSLASNHSMDCTTKTVECINNSYKYWSSKNVVFDGFNDSSEENKYNIGEENGIKYGFLAYTNTLNGLNNYISGNEQLIDLYDEDKVKKEVNELKEKVDVIIVAMHWHKNSSEYETSPTQSNIEIANYLSDLGVDIILGTYSHCLQPFDIINNHTVVFYSLGNFISNQGDLIDSIGYKGIVGVLAGMDITKTTNEDGSTEITIDNITADLTYTHNTNHHNYKVIPFSKMNSNYNSKYKEIYTEYKNILTSLNTNINIKETN